MTGLAARLREIVNAIEQAAPQRVRLLSVGVDPSTGIDQVVPQLNADRYRRMLQHFDRIGPSGAKMMRQTASIQVCVDAGESPALTWRVLNALAPYAVSIFANSPRYAGVDTGYKSYRRHIWATLDPRRTGVLGFADDPIEEYLDFALGAPAFLLPEVNGASATFSHWMARDVSARTVSTADLVVSRPAAGAVVSDGWVTVVSRRWADAVSRTVRCAEALVGARAPASSTMAANQAAR